MDSQHEHEFRSGTHDKKLTFDALFETATHERAQELGYSSLKDAAISICKKRVTDVVCFDIPPANWKIYPHTPS